MADAEDGVYAVSWNEWGWFCEGVLGARWTLTDGVGGGHLVGLAAQSEQA